jgi:hypothetical protein
VYYAWVSFCGMKLGGQRWMAALPFEIFLAAVEIMYTFSSEDVINAR